MGLHTHLRIVVGRELEENNDVGFLNDFLLNLPSYKTSDFYIIINSSRCFSGNLGAELTPA